MKTEIRYKRFAHSVNFNLGSPVALLFAFIWSVAIIANCFLMLPLNVSLLLNNGTRIFTFLLVFIVQHVQNAYSTSVQLKLDELIKSEKLARNYLIKADKMTEAEIIELKQKYKLKDRKHEKKA